MPSLQKRCATFFSQTEQPLKLLPISSLEEGELYHACIALERAIMRIGHSIHDMPPITNDERFDLGWLSIDAKKAAAALDEIKDLISGPINAHGELYQYWFDHAGPGVSYPGNNVLLSAISRACHSLSDKHTQMVERMVLMIIHDARHKLAPDHFQQFISFRYMPAEDMRQHADYYFDNTPLTLAIKSGLLRVASELIKTGALTSNDINVECGRGYVKNDSSRVINDPCLLTAAHLAALRFNATGLKSDFSLLQQLQTCGADFEMPDQYGNTAMGLILFDFPQFHHFPPGQEVRSNDINSGYEHHLNYDHKLIDAYAQPSQFGPLKAIERHPHIFVPPSSAKAEPMDKDEAVQKLIPRAHSPRVG